MIAACVARAVTSRRGPRGGRGGRGANPSRIEGKRPHNSHTATRRRLFLDRPFPSQGSLSTAPRYMMAWAPPRRRRGRRGATRPTGALLALMALPPRLGSAPRFCPNEKIGPAPDSPASLSVVGCLTRLLTLYAVSVSRSKTSSACSRAEPRRSNCTEPSRSDCRCVMWRPLTFAPWSPSVGHWPMARMARMARMAHRAEPRPPFPLARMRALCFSGPRPPPGSPRRGALRFGPRRAGQSRVVIRGSYEALPGQARPKPPPAVGRTHSDLGFAPT